MNDIVANIMEMPAVVEQLDARELLKQRFVMFPPGKTQEQMLAALAQPGMHASSISMSKNLSDLRISDNIIDRYT